MKTFRASDIAILTVTGLGSAAAFKIGSPLIHVPRNPTGNSVTSSTPAPTTAIHTNPRRRTSLHVDESFAAPEEISQTPWFDREQADTSRRAVLRQCSSFLATTAFAALWNRREAHAAEFAESPVLVEQQPPIQNQNTAPQFSDESVITPPKPLVVQRSPESNLIAQESSMSATVVYDPAPPVTEVVLKNSQVITIPTQQVPVPVPVPVQVQVPVPAPVAEVTLENSQVDTIPTQQVPVATLAQPEQAGPAVTSSTTPAEPNNVKPNEASTDEEEGQKAFVAEVGGTAAALVAAYRAVSGNVAPNQDELSPTCKVVMIENDPYGLDTGRRYYNGVDVTIDEPVPASDVREYCDSGQVNDDCTTTITGFLGELSTSGGGGGGDEGPSTGQQETAVAVLSYLDSLDRNDDPTTSSETAMAFSSYLNVLSNGEVDAPASPQYVADYLDSVSGDGIQRLSTIENRVDALESSLNQLPGKISGRLVEWQEQQDERLTKEFMKIESYLMTAKDDEDSSSAPVNGEGYHSKMPYS